MQDSGIPVKFPIPWGNAAGSGYIRPIPQASQIGVQGGAASLTDGFPPLCAIQLPAGGVPPWMQDHNGILKQITQWLQWQQAGAPIGYDSAFSTAIGGYPKGALLASATLGGYWVSTVDNNTSNPDTGGANWLSLFNGLATVSQLSTEATNRINSYNYLQGEISALFAGLNIVTDARSLGVTYTNTYGRPMWVQVSAITTGNLANLNMLVNGDTCAQFGQQTSGSELWVGGIVPPASTYEVYNSVAGVTVQTWNEIW
jgi:hypothetical protein